MQRELNKLIFGGILDDDTIFRLGNVDVNIGVNDEIMAGGEVQQRHRRKSSASSFEKKSEVDEEGVEKGDEGSEGSEKSGFKVYSDDSEVEEVEESTTNNRRQVTFEPKPIDLSILYSNEKEGEIVFRLTELYAPKNQEQRQRMINFNLDKMRTQNDDDAEYAQTSHAKGIKRKLKEDLKNARLKIRHQIRYCPVPSNLVEEAKFRYRAGMTTRDLQIMQRGRTGNKYENAPHIGRIVPSKRPTLTQEQSQRISNLQEQQKLAQQQQRQREKEDELKYKWYIHIGDDSTKEGMINQNASMIDILGAIKVPLNEATKETTEELTHSKDEDMPQQPDIATGYQATELSYMQILQKMRDHELSLLDLPKEDRQIIKEYLQIQKQSLINSKYPGSLSNLSKVEKQALSFMKHVSASNFTYRGKKTQFKSEEMINGVFDVLGGAHNSNDNQYMRNHPIFNLPTHSNEDRFSDANENGGMRDDHQHISRVPENKDVSINGENDQTIYSFYMEQKFKQMADQGAKVKRRKYWGEPTDCASIRQIEKDNFQYRQFLNKKYLERGRKEEELFTFEKASTVPINVSVPKPTFGKIIEEPKVVAALPAVNKHAPIKDLQEYEFFQSQKSKFYATQSSQINQTQDEASLRQLNSVMRAAKFALGDITEEEYYQQEMLEEQYNEQQAMLVVKPTTDIRTTAQTTAIQRKAAWASQSADLNENFDFYYERRKKELHDKMMKKIQLQEKQNQQSTTTNQTLAYASGKDVLLKATGGILDQQSPDKSKYQAMDGDYENKDDEEHNNNYHDHHENAGNSKNTEGHLMTADDNMRIRVTKSRANELNHAKCILKLTYTKFEWSERDLLSFHRPNIQEVFERIKREQQQSTSNPQFQFSDGRMVINLNAPSALQQQNAQIPSIRVKVLTNEYIEKRSKKIGINAHEYFKDRFKLSLKDGKFCIFEHIDQRPLFVNNFGMASKLKRYVYSDEVLPHAAFTKKPENAMLKHMGPYGVQVLKKKGEKIPLLGQIDTKVSKGITVLENNMYYCPVFYHRSPRNDFLCVMHQDKHGSHQIYVRELTEMYLMGQIEPKINMEVYNPQSRTYQHFIKRRTQAYVIRFLQENERISFFELNKFFSYINDQILKKIIKEIQVEVDRNQTCSLAQEFKDEQFRQLITPENICQYESAQFGEQMLKKIGVQEITNADKISYATNKFCSEEPDLKKQLLARIIEEEVLSTPWNLSQNFNHNRQQRGMMMLEGIGDPSNGHGGYSYLKLPLKISQDSLNKAKINRMYLNPAIQNPKAVTGTDADLRKLSKRDIQQKLIDLGFKKDHIEKFTRWEMVALLRDKSSQAVTQGIEGEMKKFARGVRFTSKKQREMYQKQVNDIFKKQINYLHKENPGDFPDLSDSESRDQKQKKLNEMQQINSNNSKSIVELKTDLFVKNIKDIPGYEILLMNSAAQQVGPAQSGISGGGMIVGGAFQGFDDKEAAKRALKDKLNDGNFTLKCTILRKKIKPVNGDRDKIERVIFCSDHRQIKGFNKRKHKHEVKTKRTKKTSLKEKMQTSKSLMESGDLMNIMMRGGIDSSRRSDQSSFKQGTIVNSTVRRDLSAHGSTSTIINKDAFGSSVKIMIGASASSSTAAIQQRIGVVNVGGQKSQFAEPLKQAPSAPLVPVPQSTKFTINLSSLPPKPEMIQPAQAIRDFDTFNKEQAAAIRIQSIQQIYDSGQQYTSSVQINTSSIPSQAPQKIVIGGYTPSLYEEEKRSVQRTSYSIPTFSVPSQPKPKPPAAISKKKADFTDEDYESNLYRPKVQGPRKRQQPAEQALNQHFADLIDQCMKFDVNKIFCAPVKKKDAPNYYQVITNPIDLSQMKNKAKRQEYFSKEEFLRDLNLLQTNAETFNTVYSPIAAAARDLVQFAYAELSKLDSEIATLEVLVKEKVEKGFLKML